MRSRFLACAVSAVLPVLPAVWSCTSAGGGSAAECDTGQQVMVERISLGRAGRGEAVDKDGDWCRACIWSAVGFVSCQRVYAGSADESRDSIRARARATACKDAGWPVDACPDDKVMSVSCKGDAAPEGTLEPGVALQKLYRELNPEKFGSGAGRDEAAAGDAGVAPASAE